MLARYPTTLVALCVVACGESRELVIGSACDEERPTPVVRVTSGEIVDRIWDAGDGVALFRSAPADREASDLSQTRILAATTCGEHPRELGRELEVLTTHEVVLACAPETGTLVRLDLTDASNARVLAETVGCAVATLDAGLVAVGRGTSGYGPLLRVDPNGGDAKTLVPSVRTPTGFMLAAEPLAAAADRILALTDAGELVDVDAASGEITVVRADVVDFRASADLRWVLVQRSPSDGPAGEGPLALVDREHADDGDHELFAANLAWSFAPFSTGYLVVRHESWGDDRVFTLPDVGAVALPEQVTVRAVTEVGQIVFAFGDGDWHDVDLRRWDPRDDSTVQLVKGPALFTIADDGLEVFVPAADAGLQRGDVELRAFDDGTTRVLARDVPWPYTRRDDGRIAAVRDDDGDRRGALQLHREGAPTIDVADDAWIYDASLDKGRVFGEDVVYNGDEAGPALVRVSVPL